MVNLQCRSFGFSLTYSIGNIVAKRVDWFNSFREPLINLRNALRESDGRHYKASCAGSGPAPAKRDNAAGAPDRPRPKGLSGERTTFVASP
jgi:hypothetical protein